jgi:hypothetical protein
LLGIEELEFSGCRMLAWDDEIVLKIGNGDGCITKCH